MTVHLLSLGLCSLGWLGSSAGPASDTNFLSIDYERGSEPADFRASQELVTPTPTPTPLPPYEHSRGSTATAAATAAGTTTLVGGQCPPPGTTDEAENLPDADKVLYKCLRSAGLSFLTPADDSFEAAIKVWAAPRGNDTSLPAAYVTPYSATQVSKAVKCAVASGRRVTPRGGGTGSSGASRGVAGGVTLDLKYMDAIFLGDDSRALIGPGARMGKVHSELWNQGQQLIPGCACPYSTAVVRAQGGGQGIASRKYGLLADNVIAYQVVLANGDIVRASNQTNSNLFWALRGGGAGNYGIVTGMLTRTYTPPSRVSARRFQVPTDKSGEFMSHLLNFSKTAPNEFGGQFQVTANGTQGYLTYLGQWRDLDFHAHSLIRAAGPNCTSDAFETNWLDLIQTVENMTVPRQPVVGIADAPILEVSNIIHTRSAVVNTTQGISIPSFDAVQQLITASPLGDTVMNVEILGGIIKSYSFNAYPHRDAVLSCQPMITLPPEDPVANTTAYETVTDMHTLLTNTSYFGEYFNHLSTSTFNGTAVFGTNYNTLVTLSDVWDPNSTLGNLSYTYDTWP